MTMIILIAIKDNELWLCNVQNREKKKPIIKLTNKQIIEQKKKLLSGLTKTSASQSLFRLYLNVQFETKLKPNNICVCVCLFD